MKTLAQVVLLIVVASACPAQLRAGVQINDLIQLSDGPGHPGGIFHVADLTHPLVFDSFCAELEENLSFNNVYRVDSIGTVSISGGKALTPFAAWLYDRFLGHGGGLPLFTYDAPAANTVQLGIWKSMGYTQTVIDNDVGSGFYGLYNFYLVNYYHWQNTFNAQVANNQWSGIGNVRIANLKTLVGSNAQDILIEVPEPLGAVVWPLILACIGGGWNFHTRRPAR